jgi:hypothetical protein
VKILIGIKGNRRRLDSLRWATSNIGSPPPSSRRCGPSCRYFLPARTKKRFWRLISPLALIGRQFRTPLGLWERNHRVFRGPDNGRGLVPGRDDPRSSKPTRWNVFLPMSMPIVGYGSVASCAVHGACSSGLVAPAICGQEHGRSIPLADVDLPRYRHTLRLVASGSGAMKTRRPSP